MKNKIFCLKFSQLKIYQKFTQESTATTVNRSSLKLTKISKSFDIPIMREWVSSSGRITKKLLLSIKRTPLSVELICVMVAGMIIDIVWPIWVAYRQRVHPQPNPIRLASKIPNTFQPIPLLAKSPSASMCKSAERNSLSVTRYRKFRTSRRPDCSNRPQLEPGDRLLMMKLPAEEPLPENTKRNTPEMERRNILNKFKDMTEKGKKAFMARVTSTDLESPTDDQQQQHKPDKNFFFTNDELKGFVLSVSF